MKRAPLLTFSIAMAMLLLLLLTVYAGSAPTTESGEPDIGFLHEYSIPYADGRPLNIVVVDSGPPTTVWFTMPDANALGKLVVTDTIDFAFYAIDVPTANSFPYDLVYDGAGHIWFTEHTGNKIARLKLVDHTITEYIIPTENSIPTGIAVTPNGYIWFLERDGNKLGQFDPVTEQFVAEYPYNIEDGQLEDLAVLNDERLWFTAPSLEKVSEYRVAENLFINVPVITAPGGETVPPGDIAIGNNQVWVTAPTLDWIGIHFPGTLSFWRWRGLLFDGGEPTGLAVTSPDTLTHVWYVETAGSRVGKYVTNAQGMTFFHWSQQLPSTDSQPRNIAVANNGIAWLTLAGSNKIAQWRPPAEFYNSFLTTITTP